VRSPTLEFGRLTNLADGIFSVAMTFLAFTIHLPVVADGPDGGLPARLVELLPQFLTLALSFAFAGRCWVLHYRMHSVIPRGDEWLLILNLCLLFGIVLIPFSAYVLGNFPLSPLSVSVYAGNGTFISMMLATMWGYALVHPHMLRTADARRLGRYYAMLCTTAMLGFVVSIGVAQARPWLGIACWPGLLIPGHLMSRWLSLRFASAMPGADAVDQRG